MNSTELITKISEKTELQYSEVQKVLKSLAIILVEALRVNEEVKISDIGIFKPTMSKERVGRNPRTGESVQVPAKKKVKFRPSTVLRQL